MAPGIYDTAGPITLKETPWAGRQAGLIRRPRVQRTAGGVAWPLSEGQPQPTPLLAALL